MRETTQLPRLDMKQARQLIADLAVLQPSIYWLDFGLSYALGWFGFVAAHMAGTPDWAVWIWYAVSGFAFYRALSFIHEIAHFRSQLGSFWIVWNALCGIPLGMPSFLYYRSHYVHHNPKLYGTPLDGEYIAFQHESRWKLLWYIAYSFLAPVLLLARFVLIFPVSVFVPSVRKWVVEKGSALVIDPAFVSEAPVGRTRMEWWICESLVFAVWTTITALMITGVLPWQLPLHWLLLVGGVSVVNALRTLAAHRWANASESLTFEGQFLDSINLTSPFWAWLNVLIAPVGLRFHALHHLFPFLPYHALGEAHRRIVAGVTLDSAYHASSEAGLHTVFVKLWARPNKENRIKNAAPIPLS
jgi:fatty acid desaturase